MSKPEEKLYTYHLGDIVRSGAWTPEPDGPTVNWYERGPDEGHIYLAKVSERHHCPRTTGGIYLSTPSVYRKPGSKYSDKYDSSHPSKDTRISVKLPDGWKRLDTNEVTWNYNLGFVYCMTYAKDNDSYVDLDSFGKDDPVAAYLVLDQVQFALLAGLCLGRALGVDAVSVVYGKVRYLSYDERNLELRRFGVLHSMGKGHPGMEATFIKEDRPEFVRQNEYRFLFLCERGGQERLAVPLDLLLRNGDGDSVPIWHPDESGS